MTASPGGRDCYPCAESLYPGASADSRVCDMQNTLKGAAGGSIALVASGREEPRRTIARALARVGWRVSVAANGADALLVARAELPDLMVVDAGLGSLPDGRHPAVALRDCGPQWHQSRLVLMAADQDLAIMSLASAAGAARVVVVPDGAITDADVARGIAEDSDNSNRELWIVDDSHAIRVLVRYSCERAGWTVREFADIGSARAALSVGPSPQVLILDIHLPDGNGLDHVRQFAVSGAAVVVVSNLAGPEQVERAFAAGAADIVSKPFDLRSLVARIDKAVKLTPPKVVTNDVVPPGQPPQLDIEPSVFITHWG